MDSKIFDFMNVLYNLSIALYSILIRLAAPFNIKARQISKGRNQVFDYLREKIDQNRPTIWVHCASLGEFEQGRPVIEAIRQKYPEYRILLTFFSPSGYEIRKNYKQADYICYLPADTKANARRLIDLIHPQMVFFVKYEFWFYYINELKKREIPLYLFSAIFRPEQLFFKKSPWGKWYRSMLLNFTHLFVQDDSSVKLLGNLGLTNVTKAGDTRFDRVAEIAHSGKKMPIAELFKGQSQVVVAGSTWKPDEEILAQFINSHPETKFIIAPHETKRSNVDRLISLLKGNSICYTEATDEAVINSQVLIVDTIGVLSSLYRYADLAYIGGGFGVGIHNTLEAAVFGMPIIFGPNYLKFNEAKSMVKLGIAFPVTDTQSLTSVMLDLLNHTEKRQIISKNCIAFTNQNLGATAIILNKVFNTSVN